MPRPHSAADTLVNSKSLASFLASRVRPHSFQKPSRRYENLFFREDEEWKCMCVMITHEMTYRDRFLYIYFYSFRYARWCSFLLYYSFWTLTCRKDRLEKLGKTRNPNLDRERMNQRFESKHVFSSYAL